MKTFPIFLALALTAFSRASAQVTLELELGQEQFLPGETMVVATKITNRSGRPLHFGAEANWLTFNVESLDGFVVIKNADVPVSGEFDLESSQMGTKRVDIAPYFSMMRPGRYKVIATLRIKDLSAETASAPKLFDIISGAKLWTQEFGVPAASGAPEMRKFSLQQASYLNSSMRLFVQVGDVTDTRVYKTTQLGQTISFSRPEAQVDRRSVLHVLWQSGAQGFSYCQVNPAGEVVLRETYDDVNSRPRLSVNDNGDMEVVGGVKRGKPGEAPAAPAPVPVPAPPSAGK
ncbi:MAG: hypothetical protein P4N60_00645 [Verrucomicrobiae bacterium]|nr:hypothetical protein [Verrucomicrobiae bacterium]